MTNEHLRQRMYTLTNMYFMGIQAGIQSLHAVANYVYKFRDHPETRRWVEVDGTVICLIGGFTNDILHAQDLDPMWGMNAALKQLEDRSYPHTAFYETMANDCLSSIAFLVNEKVWDKESYPDPVLDIKDANQAQKKGVPIVDIFNAKLAEQYGETTAWMRNFLKPFQLAK